MWRKVFVWMDAFVLNNCYHWSMRRGLFSGLTFLMSKWLIWKLQWDELVKFEHGARALLHMEIKFRSLISTLVLNVQFMNDKDLKFYFSQLLLAIYPSCMANKLLSRFSPFVKFHATIVLNEFNPRWLPQNSIESGGLFS